MSPCIDSCPRRCWYAHPRAIHRNETVDLAFQAFAEQFLHATQIAQSFFARVGDERDGPGVFTFASFSRLMTPSKTARPRQSSPMPAPFMMFPSRVTLTLVPSGKTVSRCAARTTLGFGCLAGTGADDVAGFVDVDVFQSETLKQPLEFKAALFFVEGRGWNFANAGLLIQHVGLVVFNGLKSGFHRSARS